MIERRVLEILHAVPLTDADISLLCQCLACARVTAGHFALPLDVEAINALQSKLVEARRAEPAPVDLEYTCPPCWERGEPDKGATRQDGAMCGTCGQWTPADHRWTRGACAECGEDTTVAMWCAEWRARPTRPGAGVA